MTDYNEIQTRDRLLWVKISPTHSKALADKAKELGISRADFMRIVLINFLNSGSTITVSNNNNTTNAE